MKVSKLKAGFEPFKTGFGWLGKHVKRSLENLEYQTFQVPTPTHEYSVVHRAGEEREGLSVPVESF